MTQTQIQPFKFIEYLTNRVAGAPKQVAWSDLTHRMQELGLLDENEDVTIKGHQALEDYEDFGPLIRGLALDLVDQLSGESDVRVRTPFCGHALGYAKLNGWVQEGEDSNIECTIKGLSTVSGHKHSLEGVQ